MPYLLGSILAKPYECTVCDDPLNSWGSGPCGLWVMLFIYSKIPELVDTVFIVVRKKPLIFLHWYHHVTVLMFCWSAYSTMAASGLYFVAMNFTVHALMYGYYCLQALNVCPKSFPAILITLSQIAQMFVGTGVCISCWYYLYQDRPCANDLKNLIGGALMYGSYLYLFCEFAVRRYATSSSKKSKKDAEKKLA
jgi:elongation of very long chain fatty acids protein 6